MLIAVVATLAFSRITLALEDQNEKTGLSPNSIFATSSDDDINLYNGNLTFEIPIYSSTSGPGIGISVPFPEILISELG